MWTCAEDTHEATAGQRGRGAPTCAFTLTPRSSARPAPRSCGFWAPQGTATHASLNRACLPQVDVRWVANACPGPAGALEGPEPWCREALGAWRTSLGRRLGDGGSGVRGRGRKASLHRDGGPREGGLCCSGVRETKRLRGRRSASPPDPSPCQTCGPVHRRGSPGTRWGHGKGGCASPRGLGPGACSVLFERPEGCDRAPPPRGSLFARPAGSGRR